MLTMSGVSKHHCLEVTNQPNIGSNSQVVLGAPSFADKLLSFQICFMIPYHILSLCPCLLHTVNIPIDISSCLYSTHLEISHGTHGYGSDPISWCNLFRGSIHRFITIFLRHSHFGGVHHVRAHPNHYGWLSWWFTRIKSLSNPHETPIMYTMFQHFLVSTLRFSTEVKAAALFHQGGKAFGNRLDLWALYHGDYQPIEVLQMVIQPTNKWSF